MPWTRKSQRERQKDTRNLYRFRGEKTVRCIREIALRVRVNGCKSGDFEGSERIVLAVFAKGSDPKYVYSGEEIVAAGHEEKNSDYTACREHVETMLNLDTSCEVDDECSFNGAWGGDFNSEHAREVYLSSYMWDRAINAKLIPKDAIDGELTIDEIEDAAKLACDAMRDETEILTNFESVEEKDESVSVHRFDLHRRFVRERVQKERLEERAIGETSRISGTKRRSRVGVRCCA